MSKQKRAMFRRILDIGRKAFGLPTKHQYDDPVFSTGDWDKPKGRRKFIRETKPKVAPPCDPGTITYHDKLVRHFGRRRADGYGECIQRKMMSALPTQEDFDAAVPWAWRK